MQEIESVIDEMHFALAVGRRLGVGETWQALFVDAAEFAVEIAVLTFTLARAATALGYFAIQSRPVRVSSCTRPLSMRAAMR